MDHRIVRRYFDLVDVARTDELLDEFANLFSLDGELVPAGQDAVVGRESIRAHQAAFYENVSAASKHFYEIAGAKAGWVEVNWAVAARMRAGGLLTLQGHNAYDLNDDGLIQRLTVLDA